MFGAECAEMTPRHCKVWCLPVIASYFRGDRKAQINFLFQAINTEGILHIKSTRSSQLSGTQMRSILAMVGRLQLSPASAALQLLLQTSKT